MAFVCIIDALRSKVNTYCSKYMTLSPLLNYCINRFYKRPYISLYILLDVTRNEYQGMVYTVYVQMYTELFLYPVSFKLKHNRGFIQSAGEFLLYRR